MVRWYGAENEMDGGAGPGLRNEVLSVQVDPNNPEEASINKDVYIRTDLAD